MYEMFLSGMPGYKSGMERSNLQKHQDAIPTRMGTVSLA